MLFVRQLRPFLALLMLFGDGKCYKHALTVPPWDFIYLYYFNYLSYTQYLNLNLNIFFKLSIDCNSKQHLFKESVSDVNPKTH